MSDSWPRDVGRTAIYLRSLLTSLRAEEMLERPPLTTILVEDTCWRFAEANWLARRPRRWQRGRLRQWRVEEIILRAQRDHIRSLARRCGIDVA